MRQPQGFYGSPNSVITWILPNWAKEKEPKRKPFGIPCFHSKLFEFRTKAAEGSPNLIHNSTSCEQDRIHKPSALSHRRVLRLPPCEHFRWYTGWFKYCSVERLAAHRIVLRTHALTRGTHGEPRAGIVSPDKQVKFTVTHGFARRLHSRLSLWSLSAHDPIGVNHIALRYQIPASPYLYEYTARQRRNSSFSCVVILAPNSSFFERRIN